MSCSQTVLLVCAHHQLSLLASVHQKRHDASTPDKTINQLRSPFLDYDARIILIFTMFAAHLGGRARPAACSHLKQVCYSSFSEHLQRVHMAACTPAVPLPHSSAEWVAPVCPGCPMAERRRDGSPLLARPHDRSEAD